MKKHHLIAPLLCALVVLSCKKSGSSNNSSNSDVWLSSVSAIAPQTRAVDSFSYDSAHRVLKFAQYKWDTSGGSPAAGSEIATFALPAGASAPPSSYTLTYNGNTDPHVLTYDGQGRISKDTSLSGSGFVVYFSYPNGNIATTVLFDGSPLNNQIDTLFMSNGNISAAHIYLPNDAGTADSLEAAVKFGYSSNNNPAYHSAISASIGPLLYILQFDGYGGALDPISQKALNSVSGLGDGLPGNSAITYNQTTDSKGRLSQMTTSFGPAAGYILYSYY